MNCETDTVLVKLQILDEFAEQDDIYLAWKNTMLQTEDAFEEFIDRQSTDIYQLLHGYAGAQVMMLQRKIVLACEMMDFSESL